MEDAQGKGYRDLSMEAYIEGTKRLLKDYKGQLPKELESTPDVKKKVVECEVSSEENEGEGRVVDYMYIFT